MLCPDERDRGVSLTAGDTKKNYNALQYARLVTVSTSNEDAANIDFIANQ